MTGVHDEDPRDELRRFARRHGIRRRRLRPAGDVGRSLLHAAQRGRMSAVDGFVELMLADHESKVHPPLGIAIGVRSGDDSRVSVGGRRSPDGDPITRATAHDLASVTKVLATTTSIMRLVSSGDLTLDDPVRRHLPAFSGAAKESVTVRELLLHRGGLAPWHPLYMRSIDRDDALRRAAELPLSAKPDSERQYSDLGFMLLGQIVERVSGLSLAEAVAELVTTPLGLTSTRFAHPVGSDVAASSFGDGTEMKMIDTGVPYPVDYSVDDFTRWRRGLVVGEVSDGNAFHALDGISGHAGLFSTIDDLLDYGSALSNHEEHADLWHPEVARQFFTVGPDEGQSLGFRNQVIRLGDERVVMLHHPGFVGCAVGFVPGHDLAVALCSNRLVGDATPRPTDELWQRALDAALVDIRSESSGSRS